MFRPQPISSTDARKHFTRLINKVSFSSKSFVIKTYRQPIVRIVNENYIRILEEVIGKKTVNQVMQIAGNDQLFEAEKMEQIKKVFQRRLSGSPQQQPKPQPRPQPQQKPRPKDDRPLAEKPQHMPQPQKPKPQTQEPTTKPSEGRGLKQEPQTPNPPQSKQVTEPRSVTPRNNSNSKKGARVLLLSNGKNYN